MADNLIRETDMSKAQKAISGLLDPKEQKQEQQNSPEPTQEESETDQPLEQVQEETSNDEASEQVSQDEEQSEVQEKQDSTESDLYKVKVAGQEYDVTLDELRNGYSRDADYRRKTEELSYEKKQFQSESEEQRQDYSTKLNELNQLMSVAQEQLNAEINSQDLEKLYEEDPTEAARVDHRLRKKQEKLNDAMKQAQAEQQKQFSSYLDDQKKKLTLKMPEFSDPAKASQMKSNMKMTLNSYGFSDQEIAQVYDHRIVMLVNDAMKYRNMQSSKPNLAKKISKPGKVFSSGVKQTKADATLKARKERLSRLKKTGSTKDAASVFLDLINNK